MVYLWCTKCGKRYNQKKLNRKPYLSNILIFTDISYNRLYRFSLLKNIPCYVHVNISMILRKMTAGTIRLCRMKKWNQLGNSWLTGPVLTVEV